MLALLIPGLLCDAHVWRATQAALDARGVPHAVADVTVGDTLSAMARAALDQHDGPLIAVGHSMGARVAVEMLRLAPERVHGLVLMSTGVHPVAAGEPEKRQAKIDLAHKSGMRALAEAWLPGMMAADRISDPKVKAGLTEMVDRMTPAIHERQMRALLARADARAPLRSYPGPLLVIVGRQDIWSPVAQHQDIVALCPQARLEIIEEAGHFVLVEQAEEAATLIAGWIEQTIR